MRPCRGRAGRALSDGTMRAPVVEIADILRQDLLQMALIEYEQMVEALASDRSHPALGDGVRPRRSERCANLGYTNIAHPTIERGAITAVAVMNEETSRYSVPSAAFDNLLRRPRSGRMRRYVNVENLPAGVMDHEQHVKRSKRYGLDTKEVACPHLRTMLLRKDHHVADGPRRWVRCIYLATVLADTLNPSLASSAWILR